jgi:RND superfamily putative drug exporter
MRLLGDVNWWAPGPLRRLHRKVGLSDLGVEEPALVASPRSEPIEEPGPAAAAV